MTISLSKRQKLLLILFSLVSVTLIFSSQTSLQANESINIGLAAYWNFDETSGAVANDSSGNGNNANFVNSPTWSTGKVGGGITLDGVSSYLRVPDSPSIDITGDETIAFWLKLNPASANRPQRILDKSVYSDFRVGYMGLWNPKPINYFFKDTSNNLNHYSPISSVDTDKWIHITIIRNSADQTIKGYKNASLDRVDSYSTAPVTNTGDLLIGGLVEGYPEILDGALDEIRIYNRVLTEDEILTLASQGDTNAPQISVTTPVNGSTVSGIINPVALATDDIKITSVQFKLDGINLGSEITTQPYATVLDTSSLQNGSVHALEAVAKDFAGNVATSQTITITINNPPPTISSIVKNNINTTSVNINWLTDKLANGQIEYGLTTSYGNSTNLDTLAAKTHSLNIFGLTPDTQYHYRIKSVTQNQTGVSDDLTFTTPATISEFYISTSGSASGDGSEVSPWDLQTALNKSQSVIPPGSTIWIKGGTYIGTFVSSLNGTNGSPVIVRASRDERVIIDSQSLISDPLVVNGSYTWFWGVEITNSNTDRYVTRPSGIDVYGHHIKLINMIVHDTGNCIGHWRTGTNPSDSEIYGNILYYCGWEGTERGHGHAIYIQNTNLGYKNIRDNIAFKQFGWGIQPYTEGGAIDNIEIYGNTSFMNGALSAVRPVTDNILYGGYVIAQNPVISKNFTYYPVNGRNTLGYSAGTDNALVDSNYLISGNPGSALELLNNTNLTITNNKIYGNGISNILYPNNTFYSNRPTGTWTFVEPNLYELKRANITVYNWDNTGSVDVDISQTGFNPGDIYEVRDVQNFFGEPVLKGVYTTSLITIPTANSSVTEAIGNVATPPTHTNLEFNSFILMPSKDTTPPTISITSPVSAALLKGTVAITTNASDDMSLDSVQLKVDGQNITSPWNTTQVSQGTHLISAIAEDTSGNTASSQITVTVDNIAPSAVTNLSGKNQTRTSVTLSWTAPGDDNNTGTPSLYDIRYSTAPITEANFTNQTRASNLPLPLSAGIKQTYLLGNLTRNTTYYVAIKTIDKAGNTSLISNVAKGKTLP